MNELFVPYKESVEIKELGFDEPCLAVHYEHKCYPYTKSRGIKNSNKISQQWICTAPTFSQAFRFFRDNGIFHCIIPSSEIGKYHVGYFDKEWLLLKDKDESPIKYSYEEAELECLRKLIKICKSTN